MGLHQQFIAASREKAFDIQHRNKLKFNIKQYQQAFEKGKNNYSDLNLAKSFVSSVKQSAIDDLGQRLLMFEKKIASRGTRVLWAFDKDEALKEIDKILQEHHISMVVKSKSMISEELGLNHFLEGRGVEPVETDLGEFIVQLEGEPPYHILTPAMHKSKEDVAQLFHQKFGTPLDHTPEKITAFTRAKLREKYVSAGAGITGANFLVADIGGIALTENEGNGLMTLAFPKVHIVIAGIEKIIPALDQLGKVWPVLAQFGTGQLLTVYNSIITGPRSADENDGPEFMYVILLDNGRSKLYQTNPQSQSLACIRCGACLNACPIYKNIGGHAYNTAYTGPIGSVITPVFRGKTFNHLAHACSLCGKCTEVCPVKIPLHELLLHNRQQSMEGVAFKKWHWFMKLYATIGKEQNAADKFNRRFKNTIFKLFKNQWGKYRVLPNFAPETFSEYWKKMLK
jgi:L-lactate dehydrogenase complex protein LldF